MENKNLVVIPLFNEESTIRKTLSKIRKYTSADIVVINDGSTDRSIEMIQDFNGIKIINNFTNRGYGQTLIDGFRYSIKHEYDMVVTIDCDEQHEPKMIPHFFNNIGSWDILSGSRYFSDFSTNSDAPPKDRKQINKTITSIINEITGFKLTDSFCGFKAYKVNSLKKLKLSEPGYGMPLQLWINAWGKGLTVTEIPVERLYPNLKRSFGDYLDNPEIRLSYYKKILESELEDEAVLRKIKAKLWKPFNLGRAYKIMQVKPPLSPSHIL